jgi:hypothetical protein
MKDQSTPLFICPESILKIEIALKSTLNYDSPKGDYPFLDILISHSLGDQTGSHPECIISN